MRSSSCWPSKNGCDRGVQPEYRRSSELARSHSVLPKSSPARGGQRAAAEAICQTSLKPG